MSLPPLSSIGTVAGENAAPPVAPVPLRSCVICGTATQETMCARCAVARSRDRVLDEERRERVIQSVRKDDEDRKARVGLTAIGGVVAVVVIIMVGLRFAAKSPRPEPVVPTTTPIPVATAPPTPQPPRSFFVSVQPPQHERPTSYVRRPRLTPELDADLAASKAKALRASQEAQDYLINDTYRTATSTARAVANTMAWNRSTGLPSGMDDLESTATVVATLSEARDNIQVLAPRGLPERQGQYHEMVIALDQAATDLMNQSGANLPPSLGGRSDRPFSNVRLN